eukprot:17839-Heterococcus_DN1.PRE.1
MRSQRSVAGGSSERARCVLTAAAGGSTTRSAQILEFRQPALKFYCIYLLDTAAYLNAWLVTLGCSHLAGEFASAASVNSRQTELFKLV